MPDDVKEIVRRPRRHLPEIPLPDGDTLIPRRVFAEEEIGVCDRTAIRLDLPTTYVGGSPYVKRLASLKIVSDSAKRKNQPAKRRRT